MNYIRSIYFLKGGWVFAVAAYDLRAFLVVLVDKVKIVGLAPRVMGAHIVGKNPVEPIIVQRINRGSSGIEIVRENVLHHD